MLQELDIESYAVVDRLRVAFQPGLNLLTGETGSGKSILVDSLALLFGARASADVVRSGARRARVSGIFDQPSDAHMLARLSESGIEADGDLIVERHVLASGKSRAYVNGSPTKLALLRDLAACLGDIHGQHEQQTLLAAAAQLRMLDSMAGSGAEVDALGSVYERWRACSEALQALRGDEQERLRRIDLLRYQAEEIHAMDLQVGEDDSLNAERRRLGNVERLRESCFQAYDALYDSSGSASAAIKSAAAALESSSADDARLESLANRLQDARSTVDDVAFEVRSYCETLAADPARLETVEDRLVLLDKLKRKYGDSIEAVIAFGRRAEEELASLDSSAARAETIEREIAELAEEYSRRSAEISRKRNAAAKELANEAGRQLGALALDKALLEVDMETRDTWGPHGVDRAKLLFSANPGLPLRPLGEVASGGELSRVALALKTCLVNDGHAGDYRRTLVFDEIDTGVGGSVAAAIGSRLQALAAGSQVLCVTHLPQIACCADAHFHVAKQADDKLTTATVNELSEQGRIEEIARMLSGAEVTEAALENARQLLNAR